MSVYKYSQSAYFDYTTTASCGGSPIIITSVGTGCNAAIGNNADGKVCSAFGASSEYKMFSTSCSNDALDLSSYKRNYVVKSNYVTSEKCEGEPLQSFALAADSLCHMNPSGDNSSMYLRTNCNGGQPIWSECSDSACTNCKSVTYSSSPCQLAGAGTSNKVYCYVAGSATNGTTSGGNSTNGNNGNSTFDFGADTSSARKKHILSPWVSVSFVVLTASYFTWM